MKNTTDQKPTAAAMKAAKVIAINHEAIGNCDMQDAINNIALVIDEATSLPEILAALKHFVNGREAAGLYPDASSFLIEDQAHAMAVAILAKHTA